MKLRLSDLFGVRRPRAITSVPKIVWTDGHGRERDAPLPCPVCDREDQATPLLEIQFNPINRPSQHWNVMKCQYCNCCFYRGKIDAGYKNDEMVTLGRTSLYLQQGGGIGELIRPLSRLAVPSGSRMIDIGCGFGFSLDYSVSVREWSGLGLDPGQISAIGSNRLDVSIDRRPISEEIDELGGLYDIVMAAETLEHFEDPMRFLADIRRKMTPNGILVLTTPNADLIDRRAPLGLLVAMLSPELHAIIHSEKSVHQLLTSVGFSHVSIEARGSSLVAYASDLPYSLNVPEITIRSDLRRHLELQANQHFADRDLFIGYAGRCLLECANDRDIERGRRIRRVLGRYIRLHFDIDIEAIELPPPKVESCSLEEMAELVPLNLASILYAMSMIDLFSGVSRSELRHRFRLAGVLARQLRRATGELAMEDVLSEDLAWLCSSEEMLCAAATGDAGIVVELEKLRQSNEFRSVGRMNSIIIRSFIELVHGGHSEVAEKLVPMVSDVSEVDLALLRELRFCRGILELNSRRDASLAVGHFAMVRQLFVGTLPDELYWSALRGEFQALDRQGNHEQLSELCREIVSITSHAVDKVPRDLAVRLQYN